MPPVAHAPGVPPPVSGEQGVGQRRADQRSVGRQAARQYRRAGREADAHVVPRLSGRWPLLQAALRRRRLRSEERASDDGRGAHLGAGALLPGAGRDDNNGPAGGIREEDREAARSGCLQAEMPPHHRRHPGDRSPGAPRAEPLPLVAAVLARVVRPVAVA